LDQGSAKPSSREAHDVGFKFDHKSKRKMEAPRRQEVGTLAARITPVFVWTATKAKPRRTTTTRPFAQPDDPDDPDTESLTRELREYVSEETHASNRRHLDLLFEVSASALTRNKKASDKTACDQCGGTGEIECPYCHGTGALTVGDVLFCDNTGCKKCVVCRSGSGLVQCTKCRGCGSYANWMQQ